jgi:osmotically-inducible protein OsmY
MARKHGEQKDIARERRSFSHPHFSFDGPTELRSTEAESNFTGKGPKGYRRSDQRIREDVCERLYLAGDVDATDIQVSVSEGLVTLEGAVNSRYQKRAAEELIDELAGVRDVHNHLAVRKKEQGWIPLNKEFY